MHLTYFSSENSEASNKDKQKQTDTERKNKKEKAKREKKKMIEPRLERKKEQMISRNRAREKLLQAYDDT